MFTIEKINALNEHLIIIDPILVEFCKNTGFIIPKNIGRYPKRYLIKQVQDITLYFSLEMDCDENNRKYVKFFLEIPYTYGFGGWCYVGNKKYIKRIHGGSRIPFSKIKERVPDFLMQKYGTINTWTKELVITTGTMFYKY